MLIERMFDVNDPNSPVTRLSGNAMGTLAPYPRNVLYRFRRTLRHRSIAATVVVAIVALTIPASPAEASGGDRIVAIDPLQTASRTIIAADLKNLGVVAPIGESQIVRPALPPIAFKPFPVVDPQASAVPVASSAPILTPGGKRVAAGDYWNEINGIEKDLNARGQSLRNGTKFDLGRVAGSAQTELLATKMRHPQIAGTTISVGGKPPAPSALVALLDHSPISEPNPLDTGTPTFSPVMNGTPIPLLGKVPKTFATASPTPKPTASPEPPPDTLQNGFKDEHRKPSSPLPAEHDTMDFGDMNFAKSYTESEGSKGSAEFYLKADMTSSTDKAGVQGVSGKVATGAYILGGGGDIASASASIDGTAANVDIEAAGSTIYQKNGDVKPGGEFADSTSDSTTFVSFSVPIQVSYFVVTLAASVSGSVGVKFSFDNFNNIGAGLSFEVTPYMSVGGSFSVSIGVGIADIISVSVGIQGNLTLASISLPLMGASAFYLKDFYTGKGTALTNVYACHARFSYELRAELQYQFLAGNVGVFLSGCFIFCATIFSITLFNWSGITGNDTLFSDENHTPIGPVYSDAPEYGYTTHSSSAPVLYSEDGKDGSPKACEDFYKRYAPGL